MLWFKKKSKSIDQFIRIEKEYEIGQQEFIIVLKNGEEHTITYQGYVYLGSFSKPAVWNASSMTSESFLAESFNYNGPFNNGVLNFVPIKVENNRIMDVVAKSEVLKIKRGLSSSLKTKYSHLEKVIT